MTTSRMGGATELPSELGEYSWHLLAAVNVGLHREPDEVSDPDEVRVVFVALDSADDANLATSAPNLAVDHPRRLTHMTIVAPRGPSRHHFAQRVHADGPSGGIDLGRYGPDDMELDAVDGCVVVDRARVRGPRSQRFAI